MIITAHDLRNIERTIGHDCTAGVLHYAIGMAVRVWAKHPETGVQLNFQHIFAEEEARFTKLGKETLLHKFALEAKQAFDGELGER